MKAGIGNSLLMAALMITAALTASVLKPKDRLVDQVGRPELQRIVPEEVGDWVLDDGIMAPLVNPQQEAVLSRIYTDTLSRVYVNRATGERIMLSIAYGADQRDRMQVHYPEICYPAQGFQIIEEQDAQVSGVQAGIPVRRLVAALGARRVEPITYWVLIGEQPVRRGWNKKLVELQYGLKGVIADGLLFRVSTIGQDSKLAYQLHDRFIAQLYQAVPSSARKRLFGGSTTSAPSIVAAGG